MNEIQPVTPISVDNIKSKIHEIRGQKVMLDRDLAKLCRKHIWLDNGGNIEKCGVPTARINDGDVTFLPTFSPYGTVWHRKTGIFHMCRRYANNNVVRYISTDHSPYKTIRHRKTGIFLCAVGTSGW